MEYREAHGARIPAIGLGTWPMRGAECAQAVAEAIAAGYRHIDTAVSYGNEEGVGEGIRASGFPREQLFVTTKIPAEQMTPEACQRSLEGTLQRLGLSYVDLVLIHWPSQRLSVASTMGPLNEVKRRGLARNLGVSNFTSKQIGEAWAATKEPLVANQCEYHPYLNQDRVIAACREKGMVFICYCPLGRGLAFDEPVIAKAAAVRKVTPAQIVLRWEMQQDGVAAIPKSGDPERIRSNMDVFSFTLTPAEMGAISALGRSHHERICESSWIKWDS